MGVGWLPVLAFATLARMGAALAFPALLGRFTDALTQGAPTEVWLRWIVASVLIGVLADLIDLYAGSAAVIGATADLRGRLMRHLLAVDHRALPRFGVGDLVSRVTSGAADAAGAAVSRLGVVMGMIPPVGSLV